MDAFHRALLLLATEEGTIEMNCKMRVAFRTVLKQGETKL